MYCVYPAMSKTNAELSKKSRNKHHSNCFQEWPLSHIHTYTITVHSYMNQVPEKRYLGQWPD